MTLIIRRKAYKGLADIALYTELMNTGGAGERWLEDFKQMLISHAKENTTYALCRNERLAKKKYSCITYKGKWIVAFKIVKNRFVIYEIVLGSLLK